MENIVRPLFNFIHVYNEKQCPHNGRQLMLMYIKDMYKVDNMIMFSQMCDAGYRMGIENEDYSKWNQCVFEDIDYKYYIENHKEFIDPKIIYEQLYEWLYNNYRDLLYYTELSRSGKGFHIIFYFNVERTKNNRMMCKSLSNFIIHNAFESLGYKDIIEYNKVYDDCSDSFYQACFITLNNYRLNSECTGLNSGQIIMDRYYTIKAIYDKMWNKSQKKANKTKKIDNDRIINNDYDNDWEIAFSSNDSISYNGEYMNHHERYFLFRSIVGMCGGIEYIDENEEMIKEEWINCAKQLPIGNGHTISFYINEPYSNNWTEWIKRNEQYCYIDNEIMNSFGYSINYKNKNKDNYGNQIKQKNQKVSKERIYL